MQLFAIIVLGFALLSFGIYAFPVTKASFRVTFAKVPEAVVSRLSAFRRRHPVKTPGLIGLTGATMTRLLASM